jgi:hypothetical protein
MGKSSPTPPAPPDPYKVSGAQTGSNVQTAIANAVVGNPNVVGPGGQTNYSEAGMTSIQGPDGKTYQIPRYTQTTTLSPEAQRIYSGLQNVAGSQVDQLQSTLGNPVDASGLPSVANDFSADRQRVEQALYDRMAPQLAQDRDALESKLVNQGHQMGSAGYNNAFDQYNRQLNDLRLGITGQGLQEQQGLFGMSQANRQRSLQEMLALRNQPINEISALQSGGQVSLPNAPGFNAPQVANTDVSGNVYNSAALQNQQYQQQMQQQNAQMGGLFGLGQAGILGGLKYGPMWMSDRRLKRDIVDLGIRLTNGVRLYAYRYIGEVKRRAGVMADELQAVMPSAVVERGGYLAVRYGAL